MPGSTNTYSEMIDELAAWNASSALLVLRDDDERPLAGYLLLAGTDTPENLAGVLAALGVEEQPLPTPGSAEDQLDDIARLRTEGCEALVYAQRDGSGAAVRAAAVMTSASAASAAEAAIASLDDARHGR